MARIFLPNAIEQFRGYACTTMLGVHPDASDTAEHFIEFSFRVDIRFVIEIENVNLERTEHSPLSLPPLIDMRVLQLTR